MDLIYPLSFVKAGPSLLVLAECSQGSEEPTSAPFVREAP